VIVVLKNIIAATGIAPAIPLRQRARIYRRGAGFHGRLGRLARTYASGGPSDGEWWDSINASLTPPTPRGDTWGIDWLIFAL
jgi:hypothetical protein